MVFAAGFLPKTEQERAPSQIIAGWMNSPGHRKEILTARSREIGIGVACTPDGKDTSGCVVFGDRGKK